MTAEGIVRIVSYATASTVLMVGVIVLFGIYLPSSVPDNYRFILGGVMVVYGIYRVVMIRTKHRRAVQSSDAGR